MKAIITIVAALGISACSTTHGFVNYEKEGVYSHENAGNKKFDDVGPVTLRIRGFAWDSCEQLAQEAVRQLKDVAKTHGGSLVYDVKFESGDNFVSTPTCTTGWGWFALYGVGGLGPWVQVVTVEGVAAKSAEKAAH